MPFRDSVPHAIGKVAVRSLGAYLSEHPGFADEGHWRVEVESEQCEPLLHVIVATVSVRPRS